MRADSRLVSTVRPSPNVEARRDGKRPTILLMHYTGMPSAAAAIDLLCDPASKVSCHYVIDEGGAITQLVPESARAWHAGDSFWAGERDLNSVSIGLEIQNPGHDRGYRAFPVGQMMGVARLSRDIMARHGMARPNVLAHSDVAPGRKIDPGEKFDWPGLARAGVGHWLEPAGVDPAETGLGVGASGPPVLQARAALRAIGYGVPPEGILDAATMSVISAYQRHFRPARVDGRLDRSTLATLERHLRSIGHGGTGFGPAS